MLSTEIPSDPSCARASALRSDESPFDPKLASEEEVSVGLGDLKPSNFSIRDYVLGLRNKDITANWPFPQHLLQVCLKHDVRDLLPPFEQRNLVGAKCCRKEIESKQLFPCLEAENISNKFNSLNAEDVEGLEVEPDSIGNKACLPSDQLVVTCSNSCRHPSSREESLELDKGGISDNAFNHLESETISTITSHDQVQRNWPTTEIEVAGAHLDAEAKSFSCQPAEKKCKLIVRLSTVSRSSRVGDAVAFTIDSDSMASKVYPVCKKFTSTSNTTLNAHIDQCLSVESSTKLVVANSLKFKVKPRKKRLMVDIYNNALPCTLEDLDRRNGTNWASELNLVAPASDVSSDIKRSKLPLHIIDHEHEGAVYVDSNGRKIRILSKFNDAPNIILNKGVKQKKSTKDVVNEERLKAKESKILKLNYKKRKLNSLQLYKGEIQVNADTHQMEDPRLQTAGMSRKLQNEEILNKLEIASVASKECSTHCNVPDTVSSSVMENHMLKFSESSKDLATSSKTKSINTLVKPPSMDLGNSLSTDLVLKHSKSSKSLTSSPRNERNQSQTGITQKYDISGMMMENFRTCPPSWKAIISSAPKRNALLEGAFDEAKESKGIKELLFSKTVCKQGFIGNGKGNAYDNAFNTFGIQGVVEQESEGFGSLNRHKAGSGTENIDTQKEVSEYESIIAEAAEKAVYNLVSSDTVISATLLPAASTELNRLSHVEPMFGIEAPVDLPAQQLDDMLINQSIQGEDEVEIRVGVISEVQNICSTKNPETSFEILQEKSTTHSMTTRSNRDHYTRMGSYLSYYPDSVASTISHLSLQDSEFRDLEPVPCVRPTDQDKSSINLSLDSSLRSFASIRNEGKEADRSSQNLEGMSAVKQLEKFVDDEAYYYPGRRSPSQGQQFMRKTGPLLQSPPKSILTRTSFDAVTKISNQADTNSNSPKLTSGKQIQNPVVRLMGKNLVMNK